MAGSEEGKRGSGGRADIHIKEGGENPEHQAAGQSLCQSARERESTGQIDRREGAYRCQVMRANDREQLCSVFLDHGNTGEIVSQQKDRQ